MSYDEELIPLESELADARAATLVYSMIPHGLVFDEFTGKTEELFVVSGGTITAEQDYDSDLIKIALFDDKFDLYNMFRVRAEDFYADYYIERIQNRLNCMNTNIDLYN